MTLLQARQTMLRNVCVGLGLPLPDTAGSTQRYALFEHPVLAR